MMESERQTTFLQVPVYVHKYTVAPHLGNRRPSYLIRRAGLHSPEPKDNKKIRLYVWPSYKVMGT
jgi:hypothetical protein